MPKSECDKIFEVKEKSQAIGEFLEWLGSKGIMLAKEAYEDPEKQYSCDACDGTGRVDMFCGIPVSGDSVACRACNGEGNRKGRGRLENLIPLTHTTENLLADFFEIDLKKVEIEKREILKQLRKANKSKK